MVRILGQIFIVNKVRSFAILKHDHIPGVAGADHNDLRMGVKSLNNVIVVLDIGSAASPEIVIGPLLYSGRRERYAFYNLRAVSGVRRRAFNGRRTLTRGLGRILLGSRSRGGGCGCYIR